MVRKIKAKRTLQHRTEGLSGPIMPATQGISRNRVAEVLNAADAVSRSWDETGGFNIREAYSSAKH